MLVLSLLLATQKVFVPAAPPEIAPAPPVAPVETTAASAPAIGEKKRVERVAVYDLVGTDIEPRTVRIVTDALVVELRKLKGISVVSMDEVRDMLQHEAAKQTAGCEEESCLADIADALGVDTLITGSLAVIGEETVFGVRRIDQQQASTTARLSKRLVGTDGEVALAAIGPLVEELYPDVPLKEGETRGVADAVALRMNPPPLPVWATVGTFAVAGGVLAAGGVTAAFVAITRSETEALVATAANEPVDGKDLRATMARGQALAITTNVLVGAGALVAAAGAMMVPLTDWTGAGDE